ncbi:TRAF3-interacting protein 1 isoform X2 [Varanus komodoensis]|uniref:TRAF3-interacting protein 1 isoform X2 n=1 Tax=Varanus komodoensis TaxID=61221 RepID=UPI001CF77C02|nr:TRAF3-interacting protein 1 isoform X2 [Varanus komodoensis]
MQGSVVRRTQELLGRVIRKPPLTERLLSKPPFRYLHDVIGEVIRSTGFMKGLYTEAEMNSDNVKDKDAKINFLQKTIDVVIMVTGESLAVKPARIVAGHEPERTNELLQAIAKCCLSKLSSDEAVQKVLAGEKADIKGQTPSSSKSQNRESRTEEQRFYKEGRGDSEIKDKRTNQDQKPEKESKQKEKESDLHKDYGNRHKNVDKDNFKEGEKHERERNKNRMSKQGKEAEKIRDKEKGDGEEEKEWDKERDKEKKQQEGRREKDRLREKDKEKNRDKDKEHDKVREKGKDREKDKRRERSSKDTEQLRDQGKDKDKKPGTEEILTKKSVERSIKDKAEPDKESENSARLSKQLSTKGPRQRPKLGDEDESSSDAAPEKAFVSENNEIANELPSQVTPRRLPRPSSARPAPPRIKHQEITEVSLLEKNGSSKIVSNVIIDKENEDEDDQFVVEATVQLPEMAEMAMEATVELEGDEKHGGLVKRILETKKDYELSQMSKSSEKERPFLSEAAKRKEKDLVAKEIEKFCGSIQALCRSALLLGKIMDYIQEDMDAMKNELQMWQNENKQLEEALQKEQSITDSVVEPLKAELAELDQLIKDEQDKISAKRSNILKDDEKIQKMVHNISSRR